MNNLLKTTSLLAIATMAGVMATSAKAADLGGNCCTDLEERVAELEATTARKGNRKVSLQIYGQVSEAVLWYDDGKQSGLLIQENSATKNILGFTGNAKVTSDWSAGYKVEFEVRGYRSSNSNQLALGESNGLTPTTYNTQSVSIRNLNFYLESQTYGRLTIGKDNDPILGIDGINLANPDGYQAAGTFMGFSNNGFLLRAKRPAVGGLSGSPGTAGPGSTSSGVAGLSSFTLGSFGQSRAGDGPSGFTYAQTASMIKYTSPFFLGQTKASGFQFQSAVGQNVFWEAAIRYAEEFGPLRVAAGAGYLQDRGLDRTACSNATSNGALSNNPSATTTQFAATNGVSAVNCDIINWGASVMHTPTGLYLSGGGDYLTDKNRQKALNLFDSAGLSASTQVGRADKTDSLWWIQAGWEAKLNPLGKTTFYGTYARYDIGTGVSGNGIQSMATNDVLNTFTALGAAQAAVLFNDKVDQWGLGVTQAIDSAAMNLYLGYINSQQSGTLESIGTPGKALAAGGVAAGTLIKSGAADANQIVYSGATIKF